MIESIIVGILAGFIAGKIMRGGGFGCLINLLLGIAGGMVGGWIFGLLGISWEPSWLGRTATAVLGAVVILYIAGLIKGKK
jgi:uncharacterized membrane protein YeaQ/YmgE (transglycosylase-associated protein family)